MATVSFIKYQNQSSGALRGVAQYVSQAEKTREPDGRLLTSGQNCTPQLAAHEFTATRQMHHKDSPVWFYHYVQSFSPKETIMGEKAHRLAKEFAAQAWPDSEVLIATHLDAEHIHSHFIVNAVCWESGKMLRQGPGTLKNLRSLSDELCMKHGLSVLPKQQPKKAKGLSTREYRSAAKGESWKFRLMNTIDQCMRYASTKDEFLSLMESEGYQVRWTDSRKNITYTTPEGMTCRDDRLHDQKYTKEVMEHEFRIRAEIVHGGIETAEPDPGAVRHSDARTGTADHQTGFGRSAGGGQCPVPDGEHEQQQAGTDEGQRWGTGGPVTADFHPGGEPPHPGVDGGPGAGCGPNAGGVETGWEEARDFCFSPQSSDGPGGAGMAGPAPAGDHGGHGALADDLARLVRSLERSQTADPVRDATTTHQHIDRKRYKELLRLKVAMGHKPNDHEEDQNWQQTM